jgi:hypothetical protein
MARAPVFSFVQKKCPRFQCATKNFEVLGNLSHLQNALERKNAAGDKKILYR